MVPSAYEYGIPSQTSVESLSASCVTWDKSLTFSEPVSSSVQQGLSFVL